MKIGGIEKTSFIDYPNKLCTVLFTCGCNFKCGYCHNSSLLNDDCNDIPFNEVIDILENRKKFVDAICITGGEPTLHPKLINHIKIIKNMGFDVKLDTNGTNPDVINQLVKDKIVDYFAMDIKAPLEKYKVTVNARVDIYNIQKSIESIMSSGCKYEFRTTVCKELIEIDDINGICNTIKGAQRYAIQNFRDVDSVLAGKGKFTAYSLCDIKKMESIAKNYLQEVIIRA